jgi:3-phenylpropionate/trans-cinnamate dioxygenase ferredoxin component
VRYWFIEFLSKFAAKLSRSAHACNVAVAIVFQQLCARRAVDYAEYMSDPVFTAVLPLADLEEGTTRLVDVVGAAVLLCHDEGEIYAIENRCSHLEEPLACGKVKWGWIACPAHGARFDLATGEPMNLPATAPIRTYPVRVTGGMIEVAA